MKKVINITEKELRNIISESVKRIIKESEFSEPLYGASIGGDNIPMSSEANIEGAKLKINNAGSVYIVKAERDGENIVCHSDNGYKIIYDLWNEGELMEGDKINAILFDQSGEEYSVFISIDSASPNGKITKYLRNKPYGTDQEYRNYTF